MWMWGIFLGLNMELENYFTKVRYHQGQILLENKAVIHAFGPDIIEYLSKQVTSHVLELKDMSFQNSAITDNKGRLVSSFILLRENSESVYLIVENEFQDKLIERIEQFHISEDFELNVDKSSIYFAFINSIEDNSVFTGKKYHQNAAISFNKIKNVDLYDQNEFENYKFLSGEPEMGKEIVSDELLTNTFLTETSLATKKGCYPGQETISKILNNKGAAFFPVCLIGDEKLDENIIRIDEKKIGDIKNFKKINGKYYYYVGINRANRIQDKIIKINGSEFVVKYFPVLDNSIEKRSIELYDEAVSLFHNDKDNEAIELLKLAIEINPEFSDAYESLGVIYGRNKEFNKAIEVMQKLSEVDPSSVMAHTNMSMYFMQLGDKETAEKHKAEATLKQFEVLGNEAQKKRAEEEAQKKAKADKEKRKEMFLQVLEIDEEDALANFGMGELLLENEDYQKAAEHLEKAIQTDKKYSVAYLALAKSYIKLSENSKAKEVLEKGIDIAVNNGDLMPANEMQSLVNKI